MVEAVTVSVIESKTAAETGSETDADTGSGTGTNTTAGDKGSKNLSSPKWSTIGLEGKDGATVAGIAYVA